jgi:hypothetical protein
MKRRDFVKAMPILALSPILLTEAVQKRKHLIVLGSAATRMIAHHGQDLSVDSITVINDVIPDQFKAAHAFMKYEAPASAYHFVGDRKILKREPFPEINLSQTIKQHLEKLDGKLFILAALGGFTGTTHYKALMKFVGNIHVESKFICSIPFEFEGSTKFENPLDSTQKVDESTSQSVLVMDAIRVLHGNLSVRSAFAKMDDMMMEILMKKLNN